MSETIPDAAARLAEIGELRMALDGVRPSLPLVQGPYYRSDIEGQDGRFAEGSPGHTSRGVGAAAMIVAAINALPWLLDAAERGLMAEMEVKHADRD